MVIYLSDVFFQAHRGASMLHKLEQYERYSDMPLRLALGLIFVVAGFGKLTGLAGVEKMVGGLGLPIAGFFAVALAVTEFGGGLLLVSGYKVRYAAAALAVIMLVAIFAVKLPGAGFKAAWVDIALLGGAVSLMLSGARSISVDKR